MELTPVLTDLADDLKGELCWTPGLGWLHWDGKAWRGARTKTYGQCLSVPASLVNRWTAEHGHRPLGPTQLKETLRQVQACVEVDAQSLDAHQHLLNVQNGVVDVRTGELRPHDPGLRMTKIAAVDYTPGTTHPAWDLVLSLLPNEALNQNRSFVAQAVTGLPADAATVLHGPGQSGKSTFIGALCAALGTYAVSTAGHFDMADLRGVRLAVAEDVARIDSAHMKRLVGAEEVSARNPYRDTFVFSTSHSLVLVMSHLPDMDGLDEGTRRRLSPIGFGQLLTPNPGLAPRLKEPEVLRAVLAWAVERSVRWHEHV